MRPAVTVITATYNWSGVLRHAVASVLAQTFQDFEYLVVGDACTDDSADVVASFGDSRVRWHNLERNCGSQWGPNNEGLRRARGELIAYLGHDDLWLPCHLALLRATLAATGADFAFTLAELIYPQGPNRLSGLLPGGRFDGDSFVVPSSLMHRRDVVDRIGPWPRASDERLPVDVAWQQRALAAGCTFVPVERLTAFKFPSAARPGSYVERPSHEQEALRRRIESEPDFEARRLVALLAGCLEEPLQRPRATPREHVPPGWHTDRNLEIRGLRERSTPDMAPLPVELPPGALRPELVAAPTTAEVATSFLATCRLRNDTRQILTSRGPNPLHLSYQWRDGAGGLVVAEGRRSVLAAPLAPGDSAQAELLVDTPSRPGEYRLHPVLVQENIRWITECADPVGHAVLVTEGAPPSGGGVPS